MGWLSEAGARVGENLRRSFATEGKRPSGASHLGILAFETAKTMSQLVSLYKSLDDAEIRKLKKEVIKSDGVSFLNSKDESLLLSLAYAERLENLDKAANTVFRLGLKCSDFGLNRFDIVYNDLKLGIIDFGNLGYGSKDTEKRIEKMEKLISATSRLYAALEALSELEVSERKLKQWKQINKAQPANFDHFEQKISYQRKQVRHFREISLWSQTFDKSVSLMARVVCVVYGRVCVVFGDRFSFPNQPLTRNIRYSQLQRQVIKSQPSNSRSGPIPTTTSRPSLVRFLSQKSILFSPENSGFRTNNNGVFQAAGPSTVGGSGLGLRYANVILLAEKYLGKAVTIGDDAREDLYRMLPVTLKTLVRSKLSKIVRSAEAKEDAAVAEGWQEALREIMGWLTPMARDTLKWQAERKFEKVKFDCKPSVLLLQTLHFSDKEKVEAAIAEVLVGLSYIYRHQNPPSCGSVRGGG